MTVGENVRIKQEEQRTRYERAQEETGSAEGKWMALKAAVGVVVANFTHYETVRAFGAGG